MTPNELKKLKILFVDIETVPNIGEYWRSGQKLNISPSTIVLERQVVSIQYKWAGTSKTKVLLWTMPSRTDKAQINKFVSALDIIPKHNKQAARNLLLSCCHSDKEIITQIIELINEAHLVVGQNGDRFDLPWLKGRAWFHNLNPMTNIVSLDTLKLSRKNFNLNSHSLDYLSKYKGFSGKVLTSYDMWQKVYRGEIKTLNDLCKVYGKHDVDLLEAVFYDMLPYIDTTKIHFGVGVHGNRESCEKCGSLAFVHNGYLYSKTGRKQRYKCANSQCNYRWSDSRISKF